MGQWLLAWDIIQHLLCLSQEKATLWSLKGWSSSCSSVVQGGATSAWNQFFKECSTNASWYNLEFGQAHPPWDLSCCNDDHLVQAFFPLHMERTCFQLSFCFFYTVCGSTFILSVATRVGIDWMECCPSSCQAYVALKLVLYTDLCRNNLYFWWH